MVAMVLLGDAGGQDGGENQNTLHCPAVGAVSIGGVGSRRTGHRTGTWRMVPAGFYTWTRLQDLSVQHVNAVRMVFSHIVDVS
ncbi:hypothetical protein RRG08_021224 [Elysia crispata]|uniref:Uncharacterized protein n=1 Tax=Elysia crispata TaxID=231223 RepID=A0AAE0YZ15_9GAST|nr:hypothetical protein RRG08_021224 [Elysia crispata]